MNSFALYRLPHEEVCTLIEQTSGDTKQWYSPEELNGQTGFVLAPFATSENLPGLLIRADSFLQGDVFNICFHVRNKLFPRQKQAVSTAETIVNDHLTIQEKDRYIRDFNHFHACLKDNTFKKIVISRCHEIEKSEDEDPIGLFETACGLYPRMFIALVYTPQSGMWLTATPEVLLEGANSRWHTIALAGTMRLEGDALKGEGETVRWSVKNIEEQRYVATYITQQLSPITQNLSEEGPCTVRAANLVHLRSDFTFTLYDNVHVGELLKALHPTPAVCGLPKEEALRFILENEHTPRLYYSGFMGPLNHQTSDFRLQTSLYVSLRCMQITDTHYRLYAGGGLLRDSQVDQEWQETEAKLDTMRALLKQNNDHELH